MKISKLFSSAAVLGLVLTSCNISINGDSFSGETIQGNGNIVTRNYEVGTFEDLSVALSATVNFSVADEYTCTVRVDENLLDYLDIAVKKDELIVKKQDQHKKVNLRATVFVIDITAPSLEEATLAGSGNLNFISPINERELEVVLAGSGNVVFKEETNIDHLELNVAGSGDIYLEKGSILELEADIAGSGKIVSHAEVQDLDVNVMGSGDITAKVNGELEYFVAGSGDIKYYGNPEVKGRIAGSGSIHRIDDSTR